MALTKWRPIPGYPDLEVSEDLQFRTTKRTVAYVRPTGTVSHRSFPSKKLKVQWLHKDGYATVFVSRIRRAIGCHVLVCLAWHGLPPIDKPFALHRDGDAANFTQGNLYWGDHKDNALDADKHGTLARGEKHGRAKLTEDQVLAIRVSNAPHTHLAAKYGVNERTILSVRKHLTWTHL